MKKLIIGLAITINFISTIMGVTIQTNDDQQFEISLELAKQIPVIKDMLEVIGESEAIPLPTVTGSTFANVIKLLENRLEDQINLNDLTVDQLIALANAFDALNISDVQRQVVNKLITLSGENYDLFNQIFTQLERESRSLLWAQHPVYRYFLDPLETTKFLPMKDVQVVVSPDSTKLIGWGTVDKKYSIIKVWDLNNLDKAPHELRRKKAGWFYIVISPDGTKLISYGSGLIMIWDLNNLDQSPYEFEEHGPSIIHDIIISPDGTQMISFDYHTIKIWNLNNLHIPPRELPLPGTTLKKDMELNGNKLILLVRNNLAEPERIKIWDMNYLDQVPYEILNVNTYAISHAEKKLIVSMYGDERKVKIWDLNNLNQIPHEFSYQSLIYEMIVSPDDKKLIVWASKGYPYSVISILDSNNLNHVFHELDFPGGLRSFIISPNGKYLIVSRLNNILIWNFDNLDQAPRELSQKKLDIGVGKVIISPDNTKLILSSRGSDNEGIKIWNFINPLELESLNYDQIQFMIWLYKNRNITYSWYQSLPGFRPSVSSKLKAVYESLPNGIKNVLQQSLPIIKFIENPSAWGNSSRTRWWTSQG